MIIIINFDLHKKIILKEKNKLEQKIEKKSAQVNNIQCYNSCICFVFIYVFFFSMQIYKIELEENMCVVNKKKKYSFTQSNRTTKSILIKIYEIYNNSQNNTVTSIHMSIIKYILENREHIEHIEYVTKKYLIKI